MMTDLFEARPSAPSARWRPRREVELVTDQVCGIDAFHAAQRAAEAREAAGPPAGRSREMRLDLARRTDVLRRQQAAMVQRTDEQMRDSALLHRPAPPRAVLVHRDPRFVDRVAQALQDSGVDVVLRLDNGADAVGAVVAEQPDLLLVEDKLPMVGGAEVLRQVLPFCPCTIAAGHAWSDSSVVELLEAGARSAYTRRVGPADVGRALGELVRA